jgi:hypothetical protein
MRLVACRNLFKVPSMASIEVKGSPHSRHVPKGSVFEIGTAPDMKGLTRDEKNVVALLVTSNGAADASDEKLVARVLAEVEAEKKSAANTQRLDGELRRAGLAQEFARLIGQLASAK